MLAVQRLITFAIGLWLGLQMVCAASENETHRLLRTESMMAVTESVSLTWERGDKIVFRDSRKGTCLTYNSAAGRLQMAPCVKPASADQVFMYNILTSLIQSIRDPTLCVQDGGGGGADNNLTNFTLSPCNPNDTNQLFLYDYSAQKIRNHRKPGWCLDDDQVTATGEPCVRYSLCSSANLNQVLTVVPVIDQSWLVDTAIMTTGESFMIRSVDKPTLCVDSGTGRSNCEWVSLSYCDPANPNQLFKYDAVNYRIRLAATPEFCMDDGSGSFPQETPVYKYQCDPVNRNKKFIYNKYSKLIRNPEKNNLCLDYPNSLPWQDSLRMRSCYAWVTSQQFDVVPRNLVPRTEVHPLLNEYSVFWISSVAQPGMCVGFDRSNSFRFRLMPCSPTSFGQAFTYNSFTLQIRASGATHCMDDGGATTPGSVDLKLMQCSSNQPNQRFIYNPDTSQLQNPTKKNLCIDGSVTPMRLVTCKTDSLEQRFSLVKL